MAYDLSSFCHNIGFVSSISKPLSKLPMALYQVHVTGDYLTFVYLIFVLPKFHWDGKKAV